MKCPPTDTEIVKIGEHTTLRWQDLFQEAQVKQIGEVLRNSCLKYLASIKSGAIN